METKEEKVTTYNISNLMSITSYAKMRGVSRQTIYNWIEDKVIQTVDVMGTKLVDKSTAKR